MIRFNKAFYLLTYIRGGVTDNVNNPGGGGVGKSHVKTYGDVPQFWISVLQESLNMSPTFQEKIPNCGSDFQNCEPWKILKIWCVFVAKLQELSRPTFFRKIPNYGYLFLEKLPLNMWMGFELPAVNPRLTQIRVL